MADKFSLLPQLYKSPGNAVEQVIDYNDSTLEYGLILTREEAKELVETRDKALSESDRIEYGDGILIKLIESFKDSPFIDKYNYSEILNQLVELFYYYKDESEDKLGDDFLIELMKELFNGPCKGSVELLGSRELHMIISNLKSKKPLMEGIYDYQNGGSPCIEDRNDGDYYDYIDDDDNDGVAGGFHIEK